MAIDDVPRENQVVVANEERSYTGAFVAVFVVLALLVIGELYSFGKLSSLRAGLNAQQSKVEQANKDLSDQLARQMSAFSASNAQQLDALRTELDTASKRSGSAGVQLARARSMVAKLASQQKAQSEELKQEIAKKADTEQVGQLSQNVTATQTDLKSTKQTVNTLTQDLGMARSEMGTLIARNHDDIETLRKLGLRNYYEFTLHKNREQKVASVALILKKTNVKHHRFSLNLLADDMVIQKSNRTVDEPIFFATGGSKTFNELVVNKVSKDTVSGYISTAKFAQQVASAAPSESQ